MRELIAQDEGEKSVLDEWEIIGPVIEPPEEENITLAEGEIAQDEGENIDPTEREIIVQAEGEITVSWGRNHSSSCSQMREK